MDKLRTKTGKTFESDYLATIPSPAYAYIRVFGKMSEVAAVFEDPAETAVLTHGPYTLEGYTKLVGLRQEGDAIKICLERRSDNGPDQNAHATGQP